MTAKYVWKLSSLPCLYVSFPLLLLSLIISPNVLVVASLFCYFFFLTISLIVINTKKTLHSFRWAFQSHFQDCAKEFPSRDRHWKLKETERRESEDRHRGREKLFSSFLFDVHWCIDLLFGLFWSTNAHHSNANETVPNVLPTRISCHRIHVSDKFLDWIK